MIGQHKFQMFVMRLDLLKVTRNILMAQSFQTRLFSSIKESVIRMNTY